MSLVVVDYGMGNLRSVEKAFQRLGCPVEISADARRIAAADRLVLPGVGHFARGMAELKARGLLSVLGERAMGARVPTLGICLGLQLLSRGSEEGDCEGLGWIAARTIQLRVPQGALRVPHFGWNTLEVVRASPLLPAEVQDASFYFAHSYHLAEHDPALVLATARYGVEFPAVVRAGNLFGAQFHPEKSHRRGLALLRRFLEVA